jgi:hypothetical protein
MERDYPDMDIPAWYLPTRQISQVVKTIQFSSRFSARVDDEDCKERTPPPVPAPLPFLLVLVVLQRGTG